MLIDPQKCGRKLSMKPLIYTLPLRKLLQTRKEESLGFELKEVISEKKRKLELYLMDGFLTDLNLVKALANKITLISKGS